MTCQKKSRPNSQRAQRATPGSKPGVTLSAVWLYQTSLLEVQDVFDRRCDGRHGAAARGAGDQAGTSPPGRPKVAGHALSARPRRGARQVVRPAQGGRHAGQQEALPGKDDRLPALDAEMGQPDPRRRSRMHEPGLGERHHVRGNQGRQSELLDVPFLDYRRLHARDRRVCPPRYAGHGGPSPRFGDGDWEVPGRDAAGAHPPFGPGRPVLFKGVRGGVAKERDPGQHDREWRPL